MLRCTARVQAPSEHHNQYNSHTSQLVIVTQSKDRRTIPNIIIHIINSNSNNVTVTSNKSFKILGIGCSVLRVNSFFRQTLCRKVCLFYAAKLGKPQTGSVKDSEFSGEVWEFYKWVISPKYTANAQIEPKDLDEEPMWGHNVGLFLICSNKMSF